MNSFQLSFLYVNKKILVPGECKPEVIIFTKGKLMIGQYYLWVTLIKSSGNVY